MSRKVQNIEGKISKGNATYEDALTYAREESRVMTNAMRKNIPDLLTNGKLFRVDAENVIGRPLRYGGKQVADFSAKIQQMMNDEAEVGINAIVPEQNEDQITGIITGICNAESYQDGSERLFSQIENFLEGTVDDCVRENADFHYRAGLSPMIERRAVGKCCTWCSNLAGVYHYEDVSDRGNDVFRRHRNCHCVVSYNPGDGSKNRQNVHTKRWTDESNADIIDQRAGQNTKQFGKMDGADRAALFSKNWQKASLKETVEKFAPGASPRKSEDGKKIYYTSADKKISVIYDIDGNYFRIKDNTIPSKKNHLSINGENMMNFVENGITHGRSDYDYQMNTHFLNTD